MNSFRVISNVKLIASNVHTKKTTSTFRSWFSPTPIITSNFNIHVFIFLVQKTGMQEELILPELEMR